MTPAASSGAGGPRGRATRIAGTVWSCGRLGRDQLADS